MDCAMWNVHCAVSIVLFKNKILGQDYNITEIPPKPDTALDQETIGQSVTMYD